MVDDYQPLDIDIPSTLTCKNTLIFNVNNTNSIMNTSIKVKEIMTQSVISLKPDSTLIEIRRLFKQNNFHHIPVLNDQQSLLGIISDRDLLREIESLSRETSGSIWTRKKLAGLTAKDFMTTFPIVLDPEDEIGLAADIFLSNQFHALPVVDDHELKGIVTTHDILNFAFGAIDPVFDELDSGIN